MNLLKYSNTAERTIHGSSDLFIDSFKVKIQEKLRLFGVQTAIQNDTVKFDRIGSYTADAGKNSSEAMKIFSAGTIRIEKMTSARIRIHWEVQLDYLLFLSLLIGLVMEGIAEFVSATIMLSVSFGLLFATIGYVLGCAWIKSEIDEIVEDSI